MQTKLGPRRRRTLRALQRGFTLIELMLVVTIIGILVSFSYPYFTRFNARARSAEAQIVFSKLNTYFVNLYENNGTFGTLQTSAYNPDPTTAVIGQAALWNSALTGWTDVPFAFDGGLKMRYVYTVVAPGSMTITVEGSIPGLGGPLPTAQQGGNYMMIETLTGSTITTVEIPSM